MRTGTAQEIFSSLGNRGEYAALPSITVDEIQRILDFAREGMVDKRVEAEAAVYRLRLIELLEVHEYIDNSDQHQTKLTNEALSADAGVQLLAELKRYQDALVEISKLQSDTRKSSAAWEIAMNALKK